MKPYILGLAITAICVSAVCMVCSLCAWQATGCIEWGLILIASGTLTKVMLDAL
jgi:hypothetical protein